METNSTKVVKSGIWYTLSNFLVKSIGLITTPIFTRLLTQEEFGLYNNYTSWLAILLIFATLNLESTLISARYDFEESFDEYILSVLSLSSLSVALWMLGLNICAPFVVEHTGLERVHINCMLLYLFFLPAINLYQARERYYFEYKKSVLIGLLMAIGTSLISVLFVMTMDNGLLGRILGNVVPVLLIGGVLYFIIIKNGKKVTTKYWKNALKISLPYIPHLLSLTFLNSVDRVMITDLCGAKDNGLYSLAYSCGAIVTLLMTSLNSAVGPWVGERLSKKDIVSIQDFSKKYMWLFVSLAIGIIAIAPEILLILGGKDYVEAKYVMIPVALGCICQFMYTMYVNVEQFSKKTVGMALASISAAILNYVLNLFFIPRFGYIAAAYTTLIGYLWLLLVHMFLVHRIGLGNVYSKKHLVLSLAVSMVVSLLMLFLYDNTIVRYVVVCIYGLLLLLVLIKNRKLLLGFLKK